MAEREPVREEEAPSRLDLFAHRGSSLDEAPGWRQPSLAGRPAPVTIAPAPRVPSELRELERYLFLALLLVGGMLLLSLAAGAGNEFYATALRVPILFAVLVVCATAIVRLRRAKQGLVRTGAPSARDAVTGLPDEQYFWLRLREEHGRNRRYGTPFSVAVIDVDDLASVNHAHGHAGGDAVLNHVARVVEAAKRTPDVAVRLSDDELAIVLLECDREGADAFAQRLAQYVSQQPAMLVRNGGELTLPVSISIGVAVATDRQTSAEELVARARHNLEVVKEEKESLGRRAVSWA